MRQRWKADLAGIDVGKLVSALAIVGLASCSQSQEAPVTAKDARWNEDMHWRQVDLDVAAIVTGMALAHGGRELALIPQR
jgi:hypothetical protein